MSYNGFAIDQYLDAAAVTKQLDELIKKPVYSIRKDKLKEYETEYFDKKCARSKEMITQAREVIPGGVQHNLAFNHPFPIVITKAEGAKLYDLDGNEYYDLLQAGGPTIIGSNDPVVRQKVHELLDTCARFSGGTLLPGDYTLSYSIAGLRAGTYAFTVQPTGDPAPDDGAAEETGAILRGITAEYRNGLFTLDWSAAQVPQGAKVTAYLLLDGNQYYTYYGMNDGETAVDFPAVPGVAGMVWAAWSMEGTGQPVFPQYQEEFVTLIPPEGTPYTLNGFTHLRGGLTLTDRADPESTPAFLPETALTREALLDDGLRLVLQTEDTYQVAEESAGHPLVFSLFTPEGWIFTEQGAYTFMPDVAASDLWLRDLSSIVQSYVSFAGEDAWPAGEYTFGYYIDGQTAAEYTFTLE